MLLWGGGGWGGGVGRARAGVGQLPVGPWAGCQACPNKSGRDYGLGLTPRAMMGHSNRHLITAVPAPGLRDARNRAWLFNQAPEKNSPPPSQAGLAEARAHSRRVHFVLPGKVGLGGVGQPGQQRSRLASPHPPVAFPVGNSPEGKHGLWLDPACVPLLR